jgi:copper resistance protein B
MQPSKKFISSFIATAFLACGLLGAVPSAKGQDSEVENWTSVEEKPLSFEELDLHLAELPPPIMDSAIHSFLLFDLLEYRANDSGPDTFNWDFAGWIGGDYNRFWIKSDGSLDLGSSNRGIGDLQLLYGRMIAPYWDLQAGVRFNGNLGSGLDGNSRSYGVIGLQGLAPYRFELEPSLYFSDRGEVSAQLTASYDLLLTDKLILQPRLEGAISLDGDQRFGTGDGLNDIEIGLRLRYEIRREIAPYIGVSWERSFGETASIARSAGDPVDNVSFVAGFRLWW